MRAKIRACIAMLLLGSMLAACETKPVPVEVAMEQCKKRAASAASPTGTVKVGVDSKGNVSSGLIIELSTDYIAGKEPAEVYERCVVQKSGDKPTQPWPG